MKKTMIIVGIVLAPLIVMIVGVVWFVPQKPDTNNSEDVTTTRVDSHTPQIHDVTVDIEQGLLFRSFERQKIRKDIVSEMYGGIVPHHILVSDIIDDFFYQISLRKNPKKFIIVGPNHSDVGQSKAVSGHVSWITPVGMVTQDFSILDTLEQEGFISYDDKNFSQEHSVAVLTPFIRYYFPEAQIVPIILTSKNTLEESLRLADRLSDFVDDDTMIIGSIDFSHYLPLNVANRNDRITRRAIKEHNYELIASMNSDFIDSSPSAIVLLRVMKNTNTPHLEVIEHTNSAQFLNKELLETTSYFSLFFTSQKYVEEVSIMFGGDVMLSRTVNAKMEEYEDYTWPFRSIKTLLLNPDISVINLEAPFVYSKNYNVPTGSTTFKAHPLGVEGLKLSGINLVDLANNHFGNQGLEGMTDTFSILEKNNIQYIGAGVNRQSAHMPAIIESKGVVFGFLAYGYPDSLYVATEQGAGIAHMNIEQAVRDVQILKKQAHVVMVQMHAGTEYTETPNQKQITFARAMIDAGADMVVGHHPHWVQKVEEYNGSPIVYSLGNLVFDQMWSLETQQGVLAKVVFDGSTLLRVEFTPIRIHDFGQPRVAELPSDQDAILERMGIDSWIWTFDGR
jgi:AmmeMemoRadiSam system protein B